MKMGGARTAVNNLNSMVFRSQVPVGWQELQVEILSNTGKFLPHHEVGTLFEYPQNRVHIIGIVVHVKGNSQPVVPSRTDYIFFRQAGQQRFHMVRLQHHQRAPTLSDGVLTRIPSSRAPSISI